MTGTNILGLVTCLVGVSDVDLTRPGAVKKKTCWLNIYIYIYITAEYNGPHTFLDHRPLDQMTITLAVPLSQVYAIVHFFYCPLSLRLILSLLLPLLSFSI